MSTKYIRLFIEAPLSQSQNLTLEKTQSHYLVNVMRTRTGEQIRIFNGKDGEWLATVETPSKKACELLPIQKLRPQTEEPYKALLFPPIRQNRLDFMIEKATELGVSDFYPILTEHTTIKKINPERLLKITIEASEQSERLSIPNFHPLKSLRETLNEWDSEKKINVAIERQDFPTLSASQGASASLVGPEGGFAEKELTFFKSFDFLHPISLGPSILRTETAAIIMLAAV